MAYSLTNYKSFMETGQSTTLIDMIQKQNVILQLLPFTDNGALMNDKWVYQYKRRETQLTANTREVGADYTPTEIQALVPYTVELAILGGKYTVDRTMKNAGNALVDFIADNEAQQIEAAQAKFNDLVINGDNNNAGEFDGLDVALAGTSTEYNLLDVLDLSSQAAIAANAATFRFQMNQWLESLRRQPDMFLVNKSFHTVLTEIAMVLGVYSITKDNFGASVSNFNGIPFVKAGEKSGSSSQIIATETRTVSAVEYTGLTDIYGVVFGPKEFHGVSPVDKSLLVKAYTPNFETADATTSGAVEIVATVALEDTLAAGVFRNLKIS